MTDKEAMQMALAALDYAADEIWCENDDDIISEARTALRAALAQPDVVWHELSDKDADELKAAIEKKWVGLTADDRIDCEQAAKGNYFALYAAIEAKLKENNT